MKNFLSFKNFLNEINNFGDNDEDLISAINDWINQKTPPLKANKIGEFLYKNYNRIKNLINIKPQIYQSPIGTICYRGLEKVSNMDQVINLVSKKRFEEVTAPGYDGFIKAIKIDNYDYSPRRLAQSWSIDPDVPWRFSNSGIILETVINTEFIMNPSYTSNINKTINRSGASEGLIEEEVIHLGKTYKENITLYIDLGSIESDSPLYPYLEDLL